MLENTQLKQNFVIQEDDQGKEFELTEQKVQNNQSFQQSTTTTTDQQSVNGEKKEQSKKGKKPKKKKYKNLPFDWKTFGLLLKYLKPQWKLALISNVIIFLTSVGGMYLPLLLGKILDCSAEGDSQKYKKLTKEFFLIIIIVSILEFLRAFLNRILQQFLYNDMQSAILRQFLEKDINFFRIHTTGEILSRLVNDLMKAKSAVSGNLIMVLRNLFICITDITMLFILSYEMALTILLVMPFYIIATRIYSKFAQKIEAQGTQMDADITSLSEQIVSGIIAVKSCVAEEIETQRFDKQLNKNIELAYKKGLNNGFYQFSGTFFVQISTFAVLYFGGKQVLQDHSLSPGELATLIFFARDLSDASFTISYAASKIISATGCFTGVLDMIKYQPIVMEHSYPLSNIQLTGKIQFRNVYFKYPNTDVLVLKNISFTIQSGEYVAFVGKSGGGKSTITQLLERFYDPNQGELLLDSVDIKQIKIETLRNQIGYVSQETFLFAGTILSNVIYGTKFYTQEDLDWALKASGAANFIYDISNFPNGLNTMVGERGYTISGGQKQRISIARALLRKPKILIFDEATSALDSESEFQVQKAIDDLISIQQEQRITIIMIAHRLSTIINCNRIFVMDNGFIIEQGNHQQLLYQNGLYKQLIDRQLQSY